MTVGQATVGAILFSGGALLLCLFGISSIYSEIQEIWAELDKEMDLFKLQADDLWKDMLQMGAGTPTTNRIRRQYGEQKPPPPSGGGPSSGAGPAPGGPVTPPIGQAPKLGAGGAPQGGAGPVVIPGGNSACRKPAFFASFPRRTPQN
jgi:hypothetical protein